MDKSGVTPADLVAELGVNKETVRLWRGGERMPGEKHLARLAKMIGVDPAHLRYGGKGELKESLPQLSGEHITDEDELRLLQAYRGLKKEWAKTALRRRAVELLEEFGEPGARNPWAKSGNNSQ